MWVLSATGQGGRRDELAADSCDVGHLDSCPSDSMSRCDGSSLGFAPETIDLTVLQNRQKGLQEVLPVVLPVNSQRFNIGFLGDTIR